MPTSSTAFIHSLLIANSSILIPVTEFLLGKATEQSVNLKQDSKITG